MQRSRAQHTNHIGSQDGGQDEARRHSGGVRCLLLWRWRAEDRLDNVWQVLLGGSKPSGGAKYGQQQSMYSQQGERKAFGEEGLFAHEPPIDSPFEEEGSGELESSGEVAAPIFHQERPCEQRLIWSAIQSVRQIRFTYLQLQHDSRLAQCAW